MYGRRGADSLILRSSLYESGGPAGLLKCDGQAGGCTFARSFAALSHIVSRFLVVVRRRSLPVDACRRRSLPLDACRRQSLPLVTCRCLSSPILAWRRLSLSGVASRYLSTLGDCARFARPRIGRSAPGHVVGGVELRSALPLAGLSLEQAPAKGGECAVHGSVKHFSDFPDVSRFRPHQISPGYISSGRSIKKVLGALANNRSLTAIVDGDLSRRQSGRW